MYYDKSWRYMEQKLRNGEIDSPTVNSWRYQQT